MKCIFCLRDDNSGTRVEHIFPESLGGGDWATLPPGVVCDPCNQYFGSKVESIALSDYPLNMIRLFNGVTTKKKKWASVPSYRGRLEASPYPGKIGITPINDDIENAIVEGRISQLRMIAETRDPLSLCRLMLKIGLETVAFDGASLILDKKYDAARRFARAPSRGTVWWLFYCGNHSMEQNEQATAAHLGSSIADLGGGEVAHIEAYGFSFFVPLTSNVVADDLDTLPEPENRYFAVKP